MTPAYSEVSLQADHIQCRGVGGCHMTSSDRKVAVGSLPTIMACNRWDVQAPAEQRSHCDIFSDASPLQQSVH